jgi:hypothetical protein
VGCADRSADPRGLASSPDTSRSAARLMGSDPPAETRARPHGNDARSRNQTRQRQYHDRDQRGETGRLLRELSNLIDGDRYQFSARVRTLKEIRAKIRPEPVRELLLPPPKQYAPPRASAAKRRRGGR